VKTSTTANAHQVYFYRPLSFPFQNIAEFLREGLAANESVVLAASPRHAIRLESAVNDLGINVRSLRLAERWLTLDTDVLYRTFEREKSFQQLTNVISATVNRAVQHSPAKTIRMYGELAGMMLTRGHAEISLKLEELGQRFCAEHSVNLRCSYSSDSFPFADSAKHLVKTCLVHDHIHSNLEDPEDWRVRMIKGITDARRTD
jgi:hypothetical protein